MRRKLLATDIHTVQCHPQITCQFKEKKIQSKCNLNQVIKLRVTGNGTKGYLSICVIPWEVTQHHLYSIQYSCLRYLTAPQPRRQSKRQTQSVESSMPWTGLDLCKSWNTHTERWEGGRGRERKANVGKTLTVNRATSYMQMGVHCTISK